MKKQVVKKLVVARETLRTLSRAQLVGVAGGELGPIITTTHSMTGGCTIPTILENGGDGTYIYQ